MCSTSMIGENQQANALPWYLAMFPASWAAYMVPAIQAMITVIMIFGGIVPYLPQYVSIYKSQDAEGFSLYVCLALLVANILRILFWFGKRYELPLLVQSVIMNIVMLAMIHLCVKVKRSTHVYGDEQRIFTDLEVKYFWQWTDFQSYLDCILVMCVSLSLITMMLNHCPVYVEIIGFMALFTEAMLGVPQLWNNFKNHSTAGMSIVMVVMWMGGDTFKTIYFIARDAPIQFWMCGIMQMTIDVLILFQVYWYRDAQNIILDGIGPTEAAVVPNITATPL